MANIRNSLSLQDRFTPTLRAVNRAMESTLRVMEQVNAATDSIDSRAFQQAERDIQRANNALIQMDNHARIAGNSVADATQKSIRDMNALQAAAYGASRAVQAVSSAMSRHRSTSSQGARESLFTRISNKGLQMQEAGSRLDGSAWQRYAGSALTALGSIGNKGSRVFSALKKGAGTAGSVIKNSFRDMKNAAKDAFNNVSSKGSQMWQSLASGIYVIKQIISALSQLTEYTDKAISDMAKLNTQNYSGLSQSQAYGLAYQAAQNSRSDISTTSSLASGIAMSGVYGKGQGSLEKSIQMAETLQKALVVGGGTNEENQRALTQLKQGLASGTLQGDELRSIREQSPYLADVLAQGLAKVDDSFIGTTAGDLKQLGSEGKLTANTVIKAFEAMEDQIDKTFDEKAPKTWSQGVSSISNTLQYVIGILQQMEGGPLQKITNLVWTVAEYLQSADGLKVLSAIATVIGIIGEVLTFVLNLALQGITWLVNHMQVLLAIFLVLGTVALVQLIGIAAGWIIANAPLLLVIAAVALLITLFLKMGFTFSEIVGAICGGIMVVFAFFKNLCLAIWGGILGIAAVIVGLVNNAGLAFQNVGLGIKSFFAGIMVTVLGFIGKIAEALNKLPFVSFDYSGLTGAAERWAQEQADADAHIEANKAAMTDLGAAFTDAYNSVGAFADGWASDAYNSGYDWGSGIVDSMGDSLNSLMDGFDLDGLTANIDYSGVGGGGGVNVDGGNLDSVGSIGSDVNISDEDIKLLRDMAARDYLLQLQSVTPVAHVTFGDVRETADVNKIVDVIEQMVEEQMATALVS